MKLVFRTFIFHILCIIVFAIIYLNLSEGFHFIETNNKTMIDFLLLSTSIQSGVGFSNIYTISYNIKIVVIIQQMLMLFTHIITLYIFTI
jgi:hypothetical protein